MTHDPNQEALEERATKAMIDYVTDRWAGAFPSKEQTDAVNDYLATIPTCDRTDTWLNCEHRRIAAQRLVFGAINVLEDYQIERMKEVLDHIAYDKEYHMPQNRGWSR